jgi:hypothetical protein
VLQAVFGRKSALQKMRSAASGNFSVCCCRGLVLKQEMIKGCRSKQGAFVSGFKVTQSARRAEDSPENGQRQKAIGRRQLSHHWPALERRDEHLLTPSAA